MRSSLASCTKRGTYVVVWGQKPIKCSFRGVESQGSPFVAFHADHNDEHNGDDSPAKDDVHDEEPTGIDHVVLANLFI